MSTTNQAAPAATAVATAPATRAVGDLGRRAAGAGAITFAVTVIVQNLIRGGSAPGMGASSQEVLDHYSGHGAISFVLAATYVISGLGMAVFLGGAARRLLAGNRPGWAVTGVVGAASIMAVFAVVVGSEQALTVAAQQDHASLGTIGALWALHNSVFTVLDFSIAVALVGLARAGVAAGVTPRAFSRLAPVGAVLLLVGTLAGPSIAAGETMGLFGVTVGGFVIWLAFMIATGLRLVRGVEA